MCFNIYEIKDIFENMKKKKDIIFKGKENTGLYKTFEKLNSKKNMALLSDLVDKQDKELEIETNKRYTMEYVTDKGTLKQVVLFIAKCTGGEIKAQECEVNDIKWLDFDKAMQTITYDNTRELFKKILKERIESINNKTTLDNTNNARK